MLVRVIKNDELTINGRKYKIGEKLNLTDDLANRFQDMGIVEKVKVAAPKKATNFMKKNKEEDNA